MLNVLKNRLEQGCKTSRYPKEDVQLLPRYRGRPEIDPDAPPDVVAACADACPQEAIDPIARTIDMGRCVFCGTCERLSKGRFVSFTQDFAISVAEKDHLITNGQIPDLAAHSRQHFKKLDRSSSARYRPPVATPARPISTYLPPPFSTWPVSASTSWPPRAMPTASWSPASSPAT